MAMGDPSPAESSSEKIAETKDEDELLIFTSKGSKFIKPKIEPRDISLSDLSSPADSPGLTSPNATSLATSSIATPLPSSNSISHQNALNSAGIMSDFAFLQQQAHAQQQQQHAHSHSHSLSHSQSHSQSQSQAQTPIPNSASSSAPSQHGSPGESTLPPDADAEAVALAMSLDLPGAFGAWSAWSDQEALLINYLSSGADFNLAQSAAFAGENDGRAYAWPGAGYGDGGGDAIMGTAAATASGMGHQVPVHRANNHNGEQAQMSCAQPLHPGSDPGKMGDQAAFASLFPGLTGVPEPSSFVHNANNSANNNNIGMSNDMQNAGPVAGQTFPVQDGMTPWDMFL